MQEIRVSEFKVDMSETRDLVDPYTGATLEIVGHVLGATVTYNAPNAFTLWEPQESVERLYARASMRNGTEGVVSKEDAMHCAYTGKRMTLRETPDGRWYFEGGFNPRRATTSLADFISKASCGTVTAEPPPKATSVPKLETDPDAGKPTELGSPAQEEIEKTAEEMAKVIGADRGKQTAGYRKGAKEGSPKKPARKPAARTSSKKPAARKGTGTK